MLRLWSKLLTAGAGRKASAAILGAIAMLSYEAEFNRLKAAGRGTLRFERLVNDRDYVIIAHFHTSALYPYPTNIFVAIYHNDRLVGDRREFDNKLTADALEAFVMGRVIVSQLKKG